MKKLFLIDAYALIYRAYYAFIKRPIMTSSGIDTSAIFGFTKSILEILKKEQPTHIVAAFDPHRGKTFRHEMYPDYKANRQKSPEVIKQSVPIIKEILDALGIHTIEINGYEADDIIGTIAKLSEPKGFETYMMTLDKDYAQLVSETVFMYKPKHSGNGVEVWGIPEVCSNFDVDRPEQVIDILAIWGDSSDNVPGVRGVGEKGAKKLVKEFGGVDGIFENIDKLTEKQRKTFTEGKEQLLLSRKLVTIDTNVPMVWSEDKMKKASPNNEKLTALLREYEFTSLLRDVKTEDKKPAQQIDLFSGMFDAKPNEAEKVHVFKKINDIAHNYKIVNTSRDVDELVRLLFSEREICFDTETEGLNYFDDRLLGISFAIKAHEGFYVPLCEEHGGSINFLKQLRPVLENRHIVKIAQNIKFDYLFLKNYGINVQGFFFDTMVADYLLNPEARHNMTILSEKYLNYSPIEIETLIGEKGKNQKKISQAPIEKVAEYAIEDVDVTIQLKYALEKELTKNNLYKLYVDIEAPLIPILGDMEYEGITIDTNRLSIFAKELNSRLLALDTEIKEMAGDSSLNISSPKQLGIILFDKLKLREKAKLTKTKQYSTSEETLMELRGDHPIINKILDYRSVKKLLSTYVEALPEYINKKTGRIHTSFKQTVTATGRLSSANPNLQNIPIREDDGREIRKAFIASDNDHVLISADYSQIELRLMAHVSGDKNLINAFLSGEDVHTATAAKIYRIANEEVSRDQRNHAKTANFGIIYGISSFGLSQRLDISRSDANNLIQEYFNLYPDVKTYMQNAVQTAREKGFTETIFGRKRWLQNITSANANVRNFAERNAINAPIQGSAADIIKIAMIRIDRRLREEQQDAKMILQIHDELIFDVPKKELTKVMDIIVTEMQRAAVLRVPLIAEANYGQNWLEAH